jgi:hypothetical protein
MRNTVKILNGLHNYTGASRGLVTTTATPQKTKSNLPSNKMKNET